MPVEYQELSVHVDTIDRGVWERSLARFSDASIYQTWAYGASRWGEAQLSHLVVSRGAETVGLAQVRVVRPLKLPVGIAYVGWGPMWRRQGAAEDVGLFRAAARGLRKEYGDRRRLVVRVVPDVWMSYGQEAHELRSILVEEGFSWKPKATRTLLLDLGPSLEELRAGFRRRWRQTLAQVEKRGLEVEDGTAPALYDIALALYKEMHQRKGFAEFVDMEAFGRMQRGLPEELRLRTVICRKEGVPLSAMAWAAVGDTGLPLIAATSNQSLGSDAAYLMWWRMIETLKQAGFRYCDLGGINPERNPGGYTFKTGIAKTHGRDVQMLGEFDYSSSTLSRGGLALLESMRKRVRDGRLYLERLRKARRAAQSTPPAQPETGASPPGPDRQDQAASPKNEETP